MRWQPYLIGVIFQFFLLQSNAEYLNIGIYNTCPITQLAFAPESGSYIIFTDKGRLDEIGNDVILQINYKKGKLELKTLDKDYGEFTKINLVAGAYGSSFRVRSIHPSYKIRKYDDNLFIKAHPYHDRLQLINNIELDHYVAGVVEAEVGRNPPEEYFKLQAIICRTYAIKNKRRHEAEGFQLCDRVHCQAYHGRPHELRIREAAEQTAGTVIVDSDINLITAAFFSNCGGQTVNSEEVWTHPVPYLRSQQDSFCLHENNAVWTRIVPKHDWLHYIKSNGGDTLPDSCMLYFEQDSRKQYFDNCGLHIHLKDIRTQFRLKSAFFSVQPVGNKVELKGRGFGHGVGLCQEGAMRMAKLGLDYPKILHFYYRNVHLVDIDNLDFFRE